MPRLEADTDILKQIQFFKDVHIGCLVESWLRPWTQTDSCWHCTAARRVQRASWTVNSLACIYSAMYSVITQYFLNRCPYCMSTVVTLNQAVPCVLYTFTHTHTLSHPAFSLSPMLCVFLQCRCVQARLQLFLFCCIEFASKANHSRFIGLRRGWYSAFTYFLRFCVVNCITQVRYTLDLGTIHPFQPFFAASCCVVFFCSFNSI
jgi:hypothetical protein